MALSLDLTPEEARRLDEYASRTGQSPEQVAHDAIIGQLDEEAADELWAAQVLADWEKSGKQSRPMSELRAELGL